MWDSYLPHFSKDTDNTDSCFNIYYNISKVRVCFWATSLVHTGKPDSSLRSVFNYFCSVDFRWRVLFCISSFSSLAYKPIKICTVSAYQSIKIATKKGSLNKSSYSCNSCSPVFQIHVGVVEWKVGTKMVWRNWNWTYWQVEQKVIVNGWCAKYGLEVISQENTRKRKCSAVQKKKKKQEKKIGLIDHAWYMSPGSLTSLTCFMAQ